MCCLSRCHYFILVFMIMLIVMEFCLYIRVTALKTKRGHDANFIVPDFQPVTTKLASWPLSVFSEWPCAWVTVLGGKSVAVGQMSSGGLRLCWDGSHLVPVGIIDITSISTAVGKMRWIMYLRLIFHISQCQSKIRVLCSQIILFYICAKSRPLIGQKANNWPVSG